MILFCMWCTLLSLFVLVLTWNDITALWCRVHSLRVRHMRLLFHYIYWSYERITDRFISISRLHISNNLQTPEAFNRTNIYDVINIDFIIIVVLTFCLLHMEKNTGLQIQCILTLKFHCNFHTNVILKDQNVPKSSDTIYI